MGDLSPHFSRWEFHCKGCEPSRPCRAFGGWSGVDAALVEVLEDLRRHFQRPVFVRSGHRCPAHNRAVGGAERSMHLQGRAADVQVSNVPPAQVHAWLEPRHAGGLGLYDTFVHIDVREHRARWDQRGEPT